MEKYQKQIQIRWSDIDQNRHLRHSVYYDYGAFLRVTFLNEYGLNAAKMEALKVGPVIFREEAFFKKEIKPNDILLLDVEMVKATPDYSHWHLRHHFKTGPETVAAILNVEGTWLDLEKRKRAHPDGFIKEVFDHFPKAPDFEVWIRDRMPSKKKG